LLVVIFIVTATSGGVILASGGSLPGERLYPVKLGVEDIRLSLTADPTLQVQRNLNYVTERVDEMRELAEGGEEIPGTVVARMEAQMDRAVGYTLVVPAEEAPDLVAELGKRMMQQQELLEEIRTKTQKEEAEVLENALRLAERVQRAAELSEGDPLRMQNAYREMGKPAEEMEPESQNAIPGEPEAVMEAEGAQNQYQVTWATVPDDSHNSSEAESPGWVDNPGPGGGEAPAGASEMGARSAGNGAGASSAKDVKAGTTTSAGASKGKGH
jgi:hypothetical protein